jgi:hypothetical protein
MTSLAIDREPSRDSGPSWRTTLMGALFTVLLLVAGWIATDAQTSRNEMAKELGEHRQRIAILEEANRHSAASQSRIERGVEDIRRQLQERRYR